ncbi:protein kinase [Candidatus Woesearchaeota archaeon]|nr:protein kinase [Candidatus Woesearchaeota archaeon]
MTRSGLQQTEIGSLVKSHGVRYTVPDPTKLIDQRTFETVFGQCRDSGSFGVITKSPYGGVRKVLAFSKKPLVPLEGVHHNVRIDHLGGKSYRLQEGDQSIDFTLSKSDHLHVVGGIIEGVILRSLQGVEGVVSYRDRKFTVVDKYIFMSTEMDEAPGEPTYDLVEKGLTLESALKISYDSALTLQKIHKENVIHGDITPKNIMSDGQRTTVTDFGNSRVTGSDLYRLSFREANERSFVVSFANALPKIGTLDYFAPETFFEDSSIPSDIFSKTTTDLYLTTGMIVAPTIANEGENSIIFDVAEETMIGKGVPESVREAILFNLSVSPRERDLGRLISALGTSLGAERPVEIGAPVYSSVSTQSELSSKPRDYQQFVEARTEMLPGGRYKRKMFRREL